MHRGQSISPAHHPPHTPRSWLQYLTAPDSPLDARRRAAVRVRFAVSADDSGAAASSSSGGIRASLEEEQAAHGDLELLERT